MNPSYRDAVIADSPAFFLRCNDYAAAARDQMEAWSGTYHGTFTQQQAGPLTHDTDTGVLLDGITGYLSVSNNVQIASPVFSVEQWVKPAAFAASTMAIASTRNVTASGFILYAAATTGQLNAAIYNGAAHSIPGASPAGWAVGTWAHLALTYDGNNCTLYVNGAQVATAALGAVYTVPTLELDLARDPGSSGSFINASYKDVAFYPYALTAAQVAAHYAAR